MRISRSVARLLFALALSALLSAFSKDYLDHRATVANIDSVTKRESSFEGAAPAPIVESGAFLRKKETVLFGPDPSIRKRLISLVDASERSVVFSVYLLSDAEVVDALGRAAKRGVSVRGIVEKNVFNIPNANRKSRDILLSAGVSVRYADKDGFSYSHAKYLVSDGQKYVFSSGNYAKTSFAKNREIFAFGEDETVVGFLSSVFDADFSGILAVPSVPDFAYLAPKDAREKLSRFVEGSTGSIVVFAPSLSDADFVRRLSSAADSGRDVRVCLEGAAPRALSRNVRTTVSSGPFLHAKTVYSPGTGLFFGSANFTENSLDRNREFGIVTTDPKTLSDYETTLTSDCKW